MTATSEQSTAGIPCWYELGTSDLQGASAFYQEVLGWTVASAGMEGFDYWIASADGHGVAGLMSLADQEGNPPPNWVIYFEVDDADASAQAITEAGGEIYKAPADIPGTGRFAIAADPQGAVFAILQPRPVQDPSGWVRAFDQQHAGHGNWHELLSSDPEAGFDFYAKIFGWTKGEIMPMGDAGNYQLFRSGEVELGGMMGLGGTPQSAWVSYFGVNGVEAALERVKNAGGGLIHGPDEVPGGAFIGIVTDPQGACFAVVGPK